MGGRSFDQTMGRRNEHEGAKIGRLRQNKKHFSMVFARSPRRGFEKRCVKVRSLSSLAATISGMRKYRSYDALPDWDSEVVAAHGTDVETQQTPLMAQTF